MKIDLKKLTRKELDKLASDVEKQLERLRKKDLKKLRQEMEKLASAHGVTIEEAMAMAPAPKKAGPKTKSTPKYANPADKSQTWTGKGRKPEWFKSAIAAGQNPDSMAI